MNKELLAYYGLLPLEEFKNQFKDKDTNERGITLEWCYTLLSATDYIPNKITEAQFLGNEVDDYTEVLELRQYARDEINRLK